MIFSSAAQNEICMNEMSNVVHINHKIHNIQISKITIFVNSKPPRMSTKNSRAAEKTAWVETLVLCSETYRTTFISFCFVSNSLFSIRYDCTENQGFPSNSHNLYFVWFLMFFLVLWEGRASQAVMSAFVPSHQEKLWKSLVVLSFSRFSLSLWAFWPYLN